LVTEVGWVRYVISSAYRLMPTHTDALWLQQMHAPELNLWLTGRILP